MTIFKTEKVIAALPGVLTADTVYFVRAGVGIDVYVSDSTGSVAHKINASTIAEISGLQSALDEKALDYIMMAGFSAVATELNGKLSNSAGSVTSSKIDPWMMRGNLCPDFGMVDTASFTGAAFSTAPSAVAERGRNELTISVSASQQDVKTPWFPVSPLESYDFSASYSSSSTNASTVFETIVEFGTYTAGGSVAIATVNTLGIKAGNLSTARTSVELTPAAGERMARFGFRRYGGGNADVIFGGPCCVLARQSRIVVDTVAPVSPYAGMLWLDIS